MVMDNQGILKPAITQMEKEKQIQRDIRSTSSATGAITLKEQPKPMSDFLMQKKAMEYVENENRTFMKVVRVVRGCEEDEEIKARRNNSQPYILDDEVQESDKDPEVVH